MRGRCDAYRILSIIKILKKMCFQYTLTLIKIVKIIICFILCSFYIKNIVNNNKNYIFVQGMSLGDNFLVILIQ